MNQPHDEKAIVKNDKLLRQQRRGHVFAIAKLSFQQAFEVVVGFRHHLMHRVTHPVAELSADAQKAAALPARAVAFRDGMAEQRADAALHGEIRVELFRPLTVFLRLCGPQIVKHICQQLVLAGEVQEKCPPRKPRAFGDMVNAQLRQALFGNDAVGCVQKSFSGRKHTQDGSSSLPGTRPPRLAVATSEVFF